MSSIGLDLQRQEAWDKVTGKARYTDDFVKPGLLHAKICISSQAHAKIKSIDTKEALKVPWCKKQFLQERIAPLLSVRFWKIVLQLR